MVKSSDTGHIKVGKCDYVEAQVTLGGEDH